MNLCIFVAATPTPTGWNCHIQIVVDDDNFKEPKEVLDVHDIVQKESRRINKRQSSGPCISTIACMMGTWKT